MPSVQPYMLCDAESALLNADGACCLTKITAIHTSLVTFPTFSTFSGFQVKASSPFGYEGKMFYSAANAVEEIGEIIPSTINFLTNAVACAQLRTESRGKYVVAASFPQTNTFFCIFNMIPSFIMRIKINMVELWGH